ncbi:MAG: hypothetical protein WCD79_17580 [Chthoniobacteraceae bacterium]
MIKFARHRPLWFAAIAVCIVMAFDIFWFFTFVDMQCIQEELRDVAVRQSAIFGIFIVPTLILAYGLALCAIVLAVIGRGFHILHYSKLSRVLSLFLCVAAFGFHRFYLWDVITAMHAIRHPELAGF